MTALGCDTAGVARCGFERGVVATVQGCGVAERCVAVTAQGRDRAAGVARLGFERCVVGGVASPSASLRKGMIPSVSHARGTEVAVGASAVSCMASGVSRVVSGVTLCRVESSRVIPGDYGVRVTDGDSCMRGRVIASDSAWPG